jgi:DNA-binding transcriptional ArsR family regulator
VTRRASAGTVNRVVKSPPLDRTFAALADGTRRDILERLRLGPASISDLAGRAGMSLPGMLKHVRVLEEARLVSTAKRGRTRECRLGPDRMEEVTRWIEGQRAVLERRLDRLEAAVRRREEDRT